MRQVASKGPGCGALGLLLGIPRLPSHCQAAAPAPECLYHSFTHSLIHTQDGLSSISQPALRLLYDVASATLPGGRLSSLLLLLAARRTGFPGLGWKSQAAKQLPPGMRTLCRHGAAPRPPGQRRRPTQQSPGLLVPPLRDWAWGSSSLAPSLAPSMQLFESHSVSSGEAQDIVARDRTRCHI